MQWKQTSVANLPIIHCFLIANPVSAANQNNEVNVIVVSKLLPQTLLQFIIKRFDDMKESGTSNNSFGLGYSEKIINYLPEDYILKAMQQVFFSRQFYNLVDKCT